MSDDRLGGWLAQRAAARESAGMRRVMRPRRSPDELLDLAGNDYLGLARDPRVIEAGVDALRSWGAGSTGSRLVSGTTQLHVDLEHDLARFTSAEAALVFSSGYTANLGAICGLGGPDVLIVSDEFNHASIVDACRLARSRVIVTPHADVDAVRAALASRTETRAVVVTDAVFSTDGALAPVTALHAACSEYDATLVVDEAHSLGVIGRGGAGVVAAAGLAADPQVIRTVTLSKALGSQGGAVIGSAAVREELVNSARTFIFDTGLAPGCAGSARRALHILGDAPELADAVRNNADLLASAVGVAPPASAVVSIVVGEPGLAVTIAERCRELGVLVGCFRPPTVPAGTSRIRLTARADLAPAHITAGAAVVVDAVKRLS